MPKPSTPPELSASIGTHAVNAYVVDEATVAERPGYVMIVDVGADSFVDAVVVSGPTSMTGCAQTAVAVPSVVT